MQFLKKQTAIYCLIILVLAILLGALLINANNQIRNLENKNEVLQDKLHDSNLLLEEYQTSLDYCIQAMDSCTLEPEHK